MNPTEPISFSNTERAFVLQSNQQLTKSYRLFRLFSNTFLVKVGSSLTGLGFKLHLPITPLVKNMVYDHFCGGETLEQCKPLFTKLHSRNMYALVNFGVEAKETEADFDTSEKQNTDAILFGASNRTLLAVCIKITGIGRIDVLEKMQMQQPLTDDEKASYERTRNRLHRICALAADKRVKIYVDAEESWIQNPIDTMVDEMMQLYNKQQAIVYNTYQLYRQDKLEYLKNSVEKARTENYILGAKIVRGAYVEKEANYALTHQTTNPIHKTKHACDYDFNAAIRYCLENLQHVSLQVATHNEESCLLLVNLCETMSIPLSHHHIWSSQLQGMSDHISFNMSAAGFNVAKYVPYGPVRDVIPYLIRRAQENSSVDGQMGRELLLVAAEMKRRKLK